MGVEAEAIMPVAPGRRVEVTAAPLADGAFHCWRDPDPDQLGSSCDEFLSRLPGPTHIFMSGETRGPGRAVTTLMHGNEPSGLHALFELLRREIQPVVDVHAFIPNVDAARQAPGFIYRMLPHHKDLNRCFGAGYDDGTEQDRLAADLWRRLRALEPECCLDIHNTSGSSPAFGIATHMDARHEALVALFTQRMIITDLRMGALMELSCEAMPIVTIECGGAADRDSHDRAYAGLFRYFREPDVMGAARDEVALEFFHHPVRARLAPGSDIAFGDHPLLASGVTLLPDIERYNFGYVTPADQLGFLSGTVAEHLTAVDGQGRERAPELFRLDGNALFPARQMKLFMVTTHPEIARKDCLFYLTV